jgi:flagellin-specific chaperone FliS
MKYLDKHPINESFKNTDDEILEFFSEYYDEDPDNFKIENVLLYDNKEVKKVTPYLKEPSKYKKAKLVTVRVDKPEGPLFGMSKFSTSLETLQYILSDLERFYDMTGEKVNYKIITDYMGISIQFLVVGESVSNDASKVKVVDDLLKEFKEMFKKRGFRPSTKGNWVEIKTSGKKSRSVYGDYSIDLRSLMNKIKNGDITLQNLPRESYRDLVEWYNKVFDENLTMDILGGDHQFVIKLKNQ